MDWIKLYVDLLDHPKVLELTDPPSPFKTLIRLWCWAGKYETDGRIPAAKLAEQPPDHITALQRVGLLEACSGGSCQLHDFDTRQLSKARLDSKRQATAARVSKHRNGVTNGVGSAFRSRVERESEREDVSISPNGSSADPADHLQAEVAKATHADVLDVFATWVRACGKNAATKLDDKREKRIRWALGRFAKADVMAAVQGWQHSPHHRGENGDGTVFNELTLLLRDVAHVEKFRDLWLNGPAPRLVTNGAGAASYRPSRVEVLDTELARTAENLRAQGR